MSPDQVKVEWAVEYESRFEPGRLLAQYYGADEAHARGHCAETGARLLRRTVTITPWAAAA